MPVPLPNKPVGLTQLPALPPAPQDPPTLTDISNAYNLQLRALTDFAPILSHPILGATQLEVGEGAVH